MAIGSIIISALALLTSGFSSWISNQSLELAHKANLESTRMTLFIQFQGQFAAVAAKFPARYLEPSFRPVVGSQDYAGLEGYWLFCCSEWYATNRIDSDDTRDMWSNYYAPLVADALAIPSLRFALESIIASGKRSRGDWPNFLREVARIARATGQPLSPESEKALAIRPSRTRPTL